MGGEVGRGPGRRTAARGRRILRSSPMPAPAKLPVAGGVCRAAEDRPGARRADSGMLERAIREGEPRQRAAAVEILGAMAEKRFLQDLCMGLSDSENSVRSQAFEALWALRTMHAEYPKE